MRSAISLSTAVWVLSAALAVAAAAPGKQDEPRMAAWRDARFGMFIHWGPVSIKGTEIGWSRGAGVPIEEYDNLYKHFNPVKFDADQWVSIAKQAGMKYMVLTTKHHDGFCLWDTKQTDFNIMNSPFHRDVVKELAAACKRQGIAFGTYYSVTDWHHPLHPMGSPGGSTKKPHPDLDGYTDYVKKQTGELVKNYGPLWTLWYDVPQCFDARRGQGLIDHIRAIQPGIVVNNRSGAAGDYDTPEQSIGGFQMNRPWETCMTICNQWAWRPGDSMKSLPQCLQTLISCVGGDGNLLFNVGPMPSGEIEPRQVQRLREMGAWLAKYGQSIYGTRGGPWRPNKNIASTRKGNTVFLHVLHWTDDTLRLPRLPRKIVTASLLTGGGASGGLSRFSSDENGTVPLRITEAGDNLEIRVAPQYRREIDTIVKLDLDGPALGIAPVHLPPPLKVAATASNVYQHSADYGPDRAFDGDMETRWATDAGTKQAWIAADLGKPTTVEGVTIEEAPDYVGRVEKFEFQYQQDGNWKTIFTGTKLGGFSRKFPPVVARHIRLNILAASEGPTIAEIEVLVKKN
jgi:alpha-L-fucosidase